MTCEIWSLKARGQACEVDGSGRAGQSHKSDIHMAGGSLQTDVRKCLCPIWTFNSITLDNPEQVSAGFSLSVAQFQHQRMAVLFMQGPP